MNFLLEVVDADLEQYEDEDSSSDAEGEWVPSCWDSLAQPSRSALKSPDKSSSGVSLIFCICHSSMNDLVLVVVGL